MTSQKSLKNNVNFNDFKRSLNGSLPFPIIAFIVLIAFTVFPVVGYFYNTTRQPGEAYGLVYIFFDSSSIFYSAFELLQVGMVLCGMMTAAKSFYFLLSKKQVNVYLSLGVTRTRMFINRLVSGAITLFTSVFVPFTIIYLMNIAELGATAQMTNIYLYIVLSLFVASMAGFAISSFAMMVTGNIFEAAITMGTTSFLPTLVVNLFTTAKEQMLKGYVYDYNEYSITPFLSPFSFINNSDPNVISGDYSPVNINQVVMNFNKQNLVKGEIPKEYLLDWYFVIPVIIWAVVVVAFIALAFVLFNKRKAENANSLGKFAISRIINGAFAVTIACFFCVGVLYYELMTVGVTLLAVALSFVAYFVLQLILTRKLKKSLKSLSACAVFMVLFVGLVTFMETGYFGTYNKLPEKENIKSVSLTVPVDFSYNYPNVGGRYVVSTNTDDISMAMSLFDEVKKDDGDYAFGIHTVTFEFTTKDGETILREFGIWSPDLYNEYMKTVVNSNFFDGVLEYNFLGFDENHKSKNGEYTVAVNPNGIGNTSETVAALNYYDSQLLVNYVPVKNEADTEGSVFELENGEIIDYEGERDFLVLKGDKLAIAMYNDLSKMTYEQLLKNNSEPFGVLGWEQSYVCKSDDVVNPVNDEEIELYYYGEQKDVAGIKTVYSWLSIYPEMTETIAYFKNNHIEYTATYNVPVKQVLYTDSKLDFSDAQRQFIDEAVKVQGKNDHYKTYFSIPAGRIPNVTYYGANALSDSLFFNLSWYLSEKITKEELIKKVYADIGHPLGVVDAEKIDNVVSSSVGNYEIHNDNGRVVFIIFEDGSMIEKYLPEANVGVLK